jgi:hypothetical protein
VGLALLTVLSKPWELLKVSLIASALKNLVEASY